jgi:hypothetical protein
MIMSTDERMEKIERQLARMKWFDHCLIACIILCLVVWSIWKIFRPEQVLARSAEKVIRANGFILEDENSKQRAKLAIDENGTSLWIYGDNGKIGLVMDKEGPILSLFDKNSKACAGLMVDNDGPRLSLHDDKGNMRAGLSVLKIGSVLSLCDENARGSGALSVTKDGAGLLLHDKNGRLTWSAP